MRLFGKKGTDKPIEIFIALFVILAVAMVILKMFSSQIEQKRAEMEAQQQRDRADQAKKDLDIYCEQKCSDAKTLKEKVNFCISYYRDEIDINKNSMVDYTDALGTEGYCEDRVYCASYKPCQGSLNLRNCKKLVCDFLSTEYGLTRDQDKAARLVGYDYEMQEYNGWFQPGSCWDDLTDEQKRDHWFSYFMRVADLNDVDESGNYMGGSCFLKEGSCYSTYTQIKNEFDAVYPTYEEWAAACPPIGSFI